jgi:hypothetical protein
MNITDIELQEGLSSLHPAGCRIYRATEPTMIALDVIETMFPELTSCKILVLFDSKPIKNKGEYCFTRVKLCDDLLRLLTANEKTDGYDIIIFVDKRLWRNVTEPDRLKMVAFALYHIETDPEKPQKPYKLIDDITAFRRAEELLEKDGWYDRLRETAALVHEGDE